MEEDTKEKQDLEGSENGAIGQPGRTGLNGEGLGDYERERVDLMEETRGESR